MLPNIVGSMESWLGLHYGRWFSRPHADRVENIPVWANFHRISDLFPISQTLRSIFGIYKVDFFHLWPFIRSRKRRILLEIFDLGNLIEDAYCVGWDFNEVLYSKDRKGGMSSNIQTRKFHEWVAEFALIYIQIKNLEYTWSNFRGQAIWRKIDRSLSSVQWLAWRRFWKAYLILYWITALYYWLGSV